MQNQINQEISNDFSKKSKLLAERLPDPRRVGVCISSSSGGGELSAVPTTSGAVAKAASYDLSSPSGDEGSLSCLKLVEEASQTTLMLVEIQLWLERQLQLAE